MLNEINQLKLNGEIKKSDWALVGACWLIMQMILLWYLGINNLEESTKYIDLANKWSRGEWNFNWSQVFYSGYVSIHLLLKLIGLPPESMYIIQLFCSGMSVVYFVKIITLFIRSRFAIVCSAILYSTCFFIQQWVCALFTDSLFSSLLIVSIYYLFIEETSFRNKIICWIILFLLPLFRPVGFLFIILAFIYWISVSGRRNIRKLVFCLLYILCIGFVIKKSLTENSVYFYPYHNSEANIICGYPGNLLQYQQIPYHQSMGMFTYFINNPGMSVRLFFYRFVKTLSLTRDYFSPTHNILLSGITIFYFILAFTGSVSLWIRQRRILIFLLAGVFIFCIPSILFCVEWSGRFSLPVYCFILILCSFGITRFVEFRRSASF